jgi:hypothetical protein
MRANPFYELYLADSMAGSDFVRLFSPMLIPHVQPVFMPGNVVITGMQGAGKSMLLTLLRLETRNKYELENVEFPVPDNLRNFISCSVNLAHSNAIDFGYRSWKNIEKIEVEMLFGDFVNSLLLYDLLNTIDAYADHVPNKMRREVGFSGTRDQLNQLVEELVNDGFWYGWFSGARTFSELRKKIEHRIFSYRGFLNRRTTVLVIDVTQSKTAFGEPLGEFVKALKDYGIVAQDTNFFVDIDQYEELGNIKRPDFIDGEEAVDYRAVINRGLSRRDPRISYRIGTRPHSWHKHSANILGSTGRLEEERDYKYVDLDILLKRSENRRTYIFPSFAEDVFQRRLRVTGEYGSSPEGMDRVYGRPLSPVEKARLYDPKQRHKGIKFEARGWRPETIERIKELASKNLLSARLGEAWIRQRKDTDNLDVRDSELPWERHDSEWWRKERVQVALLQLASSNQQRPLYSGKDEVVDISNGNILTFISVNQHIWDQYIRYESQLSAPHKGLPEIGIDLQSIGIMKASEHWFKKLTEETGNSAERVKFVREVARILRQEFMADRALSYPGAANGFSLKIEELDQFPSIKFFLEDISDYGNFTMLEHTTKEKRRHARMKWYISPILCPYLRLPYGRVKEPKYVSIKDVFSWLEDCQVELASQPTRRRASGLQEPIQASLL